MKTKNNLCANHPDWRYLAELIMQKAKAGLRAEAARGYLGILWWVLEPVMYMGIFYLAFAHILHRGDENFIVFLLTGLIAWKWFQTSISTGANSLMAGAGLMNQVYVPKMVFPLTIIAINTFKFIVILLLFLIFLQFTPVKVTWTWAFLPVLVLTQLLLIVSVACLLAAIMPFFPDLNSILGHVLTMVFFLSGIFFDINKLSANVKEYLILNPMAVVIATYREVLLKGMLPDWHAIAGVVLFSCVVLALAIWLFRRFDRVYPKIIF